MREYIARVRTIPDGAEEEVIVVAYNHDSALDAVEALYPGAVIMELS